MNAADNIDVDKWIDEDKAEMNRIWEEVVEGFAKTGAEMPSGVVLMATKAGFELGWSNGVNHMAERTATILNLLKKLVVEKNKQ